jgi:ABC-type transporter lipoprotein component MlaA
MNTEEYNDMVEKLLKELNSSDPKELINRELKQINKTCEKYLFDIPQTAWERIKIATRKIEIIVNTDKD